MDFGGRTGAEGFGMNNADQLHIPPHSIEGEQAVLGGLMLAGHIGFDRIDGKIAESDFYTAAHRQIFAACRRLHEKNNPIDAITVAEALEARGELAAAGGLSYLGELAQNVPSAANIGSYARIVRERALQRRLLALALEIQASCIGPGANVEEIISQADAAMVQLLDSGSDEPTKLCDALSEVLQDLDARLHCAGQIAGLPTGFAQIDAVTNGFEPGQLIIIAARPSVGKTALACNIADNVSKAGTPVLFHTLEMTMREVAQRILAAQSGVTVHQMRSGTGNESHWSRMSVRLGAAEKTPLFIDDRGAVTVGYVRAKARRIKRQHGLGLIVIDFLQLMRGSGENRTHEIGSISRGLKALAKELQVPIIALAQLNRSTETRQDRRPQLSDLRDSGEIEQDADIVAMLHREDLHNPAPEWAGLVELLIRKNRNGPLGEMLFTFDGPTMTFSQHAGPNPRHKTKIVEPRGAYPRGFND